MFGELMISIYEIIFLISYRNLHIGCHNLFWAIFVGMMTSIIIAIIMFLLAYYFFQKIISYRLLTVRDDNEIYIESTDFVERKIILTYIKKIGFSLFLMIIGNLWSLYIYFAIDQQCIDYWTHNAIQAIKLLDIHYGLFWMNVVLLIFVLINILHHKYKYRQYQQYTQIP
jgi:hypothetical protein